MGLLVGPGLAFIWWRQQIPRSDVAGARPGTGYEGQVRRFPVRMLRGKTWHRLGENGSAAKRDQRCPARTIALMHPAPIVPADVDFSDPGSPRSPLHDDRYHAAYGAFAQASHVFLNG